MVIDISYHSTGGLPNRILVSKVWADDRTNAWVYDVVLENTGEIKAMHEGFIKDRMVDKSAPVYRLDVIRRRYAHGWRFMGNYKPSTAEARANASRSLSTVKHIRLTEAYDKYGNFKNNCSAVWVKYHNTIIDDNDLTVDQYSGRAFTVDVK